MCEYVSVAVFSYAVILFLCCSLLLHLSLRKFLKAIQLYSENPERVGQCFLQYVSIDSQV